MEHPWGLFAWVDIAVPDVAAGIRFYEHVFGWEARPSPGPVPYTLFLKDGKVVAGLGGMSAEQLARREPAVWSAYVLTPDVADVASRAVDLGGIVAVPPTEVPGAGRFTFIIDPTGASLGFWQPVEFGGADAFNDPGCLCWNELVTRDVAAATAFYGALLPEWTLDRLDKGPSQYTMVRLGVRDNAGIFAMPGSASADVPAFWSVIIAVESMTAALDRVRAAGGTVVGGLQRTGFGPIADVIDPFGAPFRIIDMIGS